MGFTRSRRLGDGQEEGAVCLRHSRARRRRLQRGRVRRFNKKIYLLSRNDKGRRDLHGVPCLRPLLSAYQSEAEVIRVHAAIVERV